MEKINRMVTTTTPVGPNSGADVNPMLALLDSEPPELPAQVQLQGDNVVPFPQYRKQLLTKKL